MSRRPNIQSKHEKKIEAGIQSDRRTRDAAMKKNAGKPGAQGMNLQPHITCYGRGPVQHEVPAAVQRWIDDESREQLHRYKRIVKDMDALAPLRDRWVQEFFERITGPRGFSVHAGLRRTIPKADIPARPDRPWRVVW